MCLTTFQLEPKIADEDIVCYKVLHNYKEKLYAYHHNFEYELNKLYMSDICKEIVYSSPAGTKAEINQALHSYKLLQSARVIYSICDVKCVIAKCIIPKGAQFFVGRHDEFEGYASNQIIIKEVMELEDVFPFFNAKIYPYRRGQKIKVSFGGKGTRLCTITNIVPKEEDLIQIKSGIFAFCTDKHGKSLDCEIDILDFL